MTTTPSRPAPRDTPFGRTADPFDPAPSDLAVHKLLGDFGHLLPPWPIDGRIFHGLIVDYRPSWEAALRAAGLAHGLPGVFLNDHGVYSYDHREKGLTAEDGNTTTLQTQ